MHGADRHVDYHRERQRDLVRGADRRGLALRFSATRDAERRSFLLSAWERRSLRQPPIATEVPEVPPAVAP
jgi:hypothetical protein